MNTNCEKRILVTGLLLAALACVAGFAWGDDVVRIAGHDLKPAQKKFIENKVEALRASDHLRRFGHVVDLIHLDSLAVPFLRKEVERGSNPIPVRCAIMTLSEIAPAGLAQYLSGIVKGSKKGRDEKTLAILGLGKVGGDKDAALLRKLLRKGEDRMVRRSAALALGRLGDRESFKAILSAGRHDREERVAVIFLLSAALADDEAFSAAAGKLLEDMDSHRLSAVVVGCTFRADPVLEETVLRYGSRDEECARALAVCLGRYGSAESRDWLDGAVGSREMPVALSALYSLAARGGPEAAESLLKIFRNAASDDPRSVHSLLAAADSGLADSFREPARQSLSAATDSIRSAAALSLTGMSDRGAIPLLKKQIGQEKHQRVLHDFLIALGLVGIEQDAAELAELQESAMDTDTRDLAALVHKVLVGKIDRSLLLDMYEARLRELSGRWIYRFAHCFTQELRYGMDLDTILRRVITGDESGDDGGSGDEGGGSEDEGGDDPGNEGSSDPPVGEIPAPGEGTVAPPPYQGGQGSFGVGRRRVIIRGEVVEWDILHWFDDLQYFPRTLFEKRP